MEMPIIPNPDTGEIPELESLRREALNLGFYSLGIARAGVSPHSKRFRDWIQSGMHAGMKWMENNTDRRLNPTQSLNGAQSIIMLCLPYHDRSEQPDSAPKIARYARGRDYHKVMTPLLKQLCDYISQSGHWKTWYCVDTAPILERDWGEASGVGWIGKNGLLIDKEIGSWFFLGGIVTDRFYSATSSVSDHCGTCTRCIDACPTDAIVKPRTIDARKCISYWTIEHKGELPQESQLHGWLFGCDICQEVCPWNNRPARVQHPVLEDLKPRRAPETAEEVMKMTHDEYHKYFAGTPLTRAGFDGLKRNAHKLTKENQGKES